MLSRKWWFFFISVLMFVAFALYIYYDLFQVYSGKKLSSRPRELGDSIAFERNLGNFHLLEAISFLPATADSFIKAIEERGGYDYHDAARLAVLLRNMDTGEILKLEPALFPPRTAPGASRHRHEQSARVNLLQASIYTYAIADTQLRNKSEKCSGLDTYTLVEIVASTGNSEAYDAEQELIRSLALLSLGMTDDEEARSYLVTLSTDILEDPNALELINALALTGDVRATKELKKALHCLVAGECFSDPEVADEVVARRVLRALLLLDGAQTVNCLKTEAKKSSEQPTWVHSVLSDWVQEVPTSYEFEERISKLYSGLESGAILLRRDSLYGELLRDYTFWVSSSKNTMSSLDYQVPFERGRMFAITEQ